MFFYFLLSELGSFSLALLFLLVGKATLLVLVVSLWSQSCSHLRNSPDFSSFFSPTVEILDKENNEKRSENARSLAAENKRFDHVSTIARNGRVLFGFVEICGV